MHRHRYSHTTIQVNIRRFPFYVQNYSHVTDTYLLLLLLPSSSFFFFPRARQCRTVEPMNPRRSSPRTPIQTLNCSGNTKLGFPVTCPPSSVFILFLSRIKKNKKKKKNEKFFSFPSFNPQFPLFLAHTHRASLWSSG